MNGCAVICFTMFSRRDDTFVCLILLVLITSNCQSGCLRLCSRNKISSFRCETSLADRHINTTRRLPCHSIECFGQSRNYTRYCCLCVSDRPSVSSSDLWNGDLVRNTGISVILKNFYVSQNHWIALSHLLQAHLIIFRSNFQQLKIEKFSRVIPPKISLRQSFTGKFLHKAV